MYHLNTCSSSFTNTYAMVLSFWISRSSHTGYDNKWDSAVFTTLQRETHGNGMFTLETGPLNKITVCSLYYNTSGFHLFYIIPTCILWKIWLHLSFLSAHYRCFPECLFSTWPTESISKHSCNFFSMVSSLKSTLGQTDFYVPYCLPFICPFIVTYITWHYSRIVWMSFFPIRLCLFWE